MSALPGEVAIGEPELLRDGFGERPVFECLIAEVDGEAAGLALYFPIYSTWKGPSIHLEDLFVFACGTRSRDGQGAAAERSCDRL